MTQRRINVVLAKEPFALTVPVAVASQLAEQPTPRPRAPTVAMTAGTSSTVPIRVTRTHGNGPRAVSRKNT